MSTIHKFSRTYQTRHTFRSRKTLALIVLLLLIAASATVPQTHATSCVMVKHKVLFASRDDAMTVFRDIGTPIDLGRTDGSVTDLRRINLALAQLDEGLSIEKTVALPRNPAWRGDPITYTIEIANDSSVAATGVHITDTLPMHIDGTDLDTTTTVPAGESVTYQINASVANDAPYSTTITNTAYYSHASDHGQSSASINISGEIQYGYLPLMLNNHYVWDDYFEPNDRVSIAYGPLASGNTYLAHADDVNDYYFFILSTPSMVTVTVDNYAPTSSHGTVALYGPVLGTERGERVDYYGPPGDSTMALGPHNLGPGKYYIQVYTATNTSTTELYSLSVTY